MDFDVGVPLCVLGEIAALEWARSEIYLATGSEAMVSPEDLQAYTPCAMGILQVYFF